MTARAVFGAGQPRCASPDRVQAFASWDKAERSTPLPIMSRLIAGNTARADESTVFWPEHLLPRRFDRLRSDSSGQSWKQSAPKITNQKLRA
jgi:hypothetical protein